MALGPKVLHDFKEQVREAGHAFQSMVREVAKLLDGGEHVDQLEQASAEIIEFAEDLALVEVELTALRLQQQTLLGEAILFVESL